RRRRPRTQLPVFFLEKFEQSLTHNEPRLAWPDFSSTCHSDRSTSASEGAGEEPALSAHNRVARATAKERRSGVFDLRSDPTARSTMEEWRFSAA
ncbi:MAG: hypothetical protein WBM24_00495, partial [Candidatus Sulfotelmatobacter sp.]